MSKTRTGRKGRARLALATDLNALGAARTAADTEGKAALLARMMQHATGQGTSGQIFSQGEVIGALSDDLDITVANGGQGPGIFAGDEAGFAGDTLSGETTLSQLAEVPQLTSPFPHYYLTEAGTTSTSTSGIAYLPSGPAGAFTPKSWGGADEDEFKITITPDVAKLAAGVDYDNMFFGIVGHLHAGDRVIGRTSGHVQATAEMKLTDGTVADCNAGDELVFIDTNGDVTLTIQFKANAYAAKNSDGVDDTITAAAPVSADNFIIESATVISIIEGGNATASNTAAKQVDNIVAAVTAWNVKHSDAIVAAEIGADHIGFTINSSKGENGNNAINGGGEKKVLGKNTLNARRLRAAGPGETAIATPLIAGTEDWFRDGGGTAVNVVFNGLADAEAGGNNTEGTTDGTTFDVVVTENGTPVNLVSEANKFTAGEFEAVVKIAGHAGTDVTTSRPGVAVIWSMS